MKNSQLYKLFKKYLNNTCTESEMQELLELFKRAENEPEIKQFLSDYWFELSETDTEDNMVDTDEWFHEIYSQALARDEVSAGKDMQKLKWKKYGLLSYNHKSSQWIKVAVILVVSLLLSLLVYTLTYDEPAEEIVFELKSPGPGEKVRFTLPDGTQVHLHSESRLEYPSIFQGTVREVRLEGEAYFVVARDETRPFMVHTKEVTTIVLGTSFNIRSYPEDSQVVIAVNSGSVALLEPETKDNEHLVILEAKQWATYTFDTRSLSTGSGDIELYTAWNEGVLLYHDKTLRDVAVQLERWYGVTISFDNEEIENCIIRGEHRDETLVNVLNAIAYAFDMEYQIDGRNIVLKGEDCQ